MSVRQLTKNDAEKLAEFFLKLKKDTYYFWNRLGDLSQKSRALNVANQQVNIDVKDEIGFVYEIKGVIMGYAYLRFFSDKEIKKYTTSLGIVIADEYQNLGIGKKMMTYMIDWAKQYKFKKIWLATYTDNKRALKMYINMNFEIEGIFMYDEFLDGKPRHVVSMALFLTDDCKNSAVERQQYMTQIQI